MILWSRQEGMGRGPKTRAFADIICERPRIGRGGGGGRGAGRADEEGEAGAVPAEPRRTGPRAGVGGGEGK